MARRNVALARSARPFTKSKNARRARRQERNPSGTGARGAGPEWSELEQAFFDGAPPDEPAPAAEPERFDDLPGLARLDADPFAWLRRLAASASAAVRRLVSRLRS
jgi:hypothetical protein